MPVNPHGRPIDWVKLTHLDSLRDTITVPTTRPSMLAVAYIVEYYEDTRYINCIMCRKSGKLDFERVGKYSGIVELVKVDAPNEPGCSPNWVRVTADDTKSIMCVVAYYTTSSSSEIQAIVLVHSYTDSLSPAFNPTAFGRLGWSQNNASRASTEDPDDELNVLDQASMPVKRRKLPDSRISLSSSGDSIPTSPAPHNEGFMVHRKPFQNKSGMDIVLPKGMMHRGLMQHSLSKPQPYQYKQQSNQQSSRNVQLDLSASKSNEFLAPFPTDNQRFRESVSDFSGVPTANNSKYTTYNEGMGFSSGYTTGIRQTADGFERAPTTQAYNRINEGPGNQALIGTSPLGYNRKLDMSDPRTAGIPHGSKPPSSISPVSIDEQICPEGLNTVPGNSQPVMGTLRPKPVQQNIEFLPPYKDAPPSYEEGRKENKGKKGNKS
ncbi:hypothetical protein HYFRA_00003677 [Hymenoscyphus fraxineus]|uniref:Uncharacterized protein n=1 Tax=Hymenoscyphus fraxineus TaxID=746836 RepID=A0A9N9L2D4_9HELO|nr:hypothetical protein HYFRA_00003677 [Hymenoscyphus fraxineus]